jgi:hypothetical protein
LQYLSELVRRQVPNFPALASQARRQDASSRRRPNGSDTPSGFHVGRHLGPPTRSAGAWPNACMPTRDRRSVTDRGLAGWGTGIGVGLCTSNRRVAAASGPATGRRPVGVARQLVCCPGHDGAISAFDRFDLPRVAAIVPSPHALEGLLPTPNMSDIARHTKKRTSARRGAGVSNAHRDDRQARRAPSAWRPAPTYARCIVRFG